MKNDIINSKKEVSRASLNSVRANDHKINILASLVRGLNVDDAYKVLSSINSKPSKLLSDLLKSCVSNAKNDSSVKNPGSLVVGKILVGRGSFIKRFMPCGRGKSAILRKNTANMSMYLYDINNF
jgi:ribosomal protein L22